MAFLLLHNYTDFIREEVQGHCHVGPRREGDPLRLRHALRGLRGHQGRG